MTNLWQSLTRSSEHAPLAFDDFANYLNFNGLSYPTSPTQSLGEKAQEIPGSFEGVVQGAYKANGVIFACMAARMLIFSEARFQFRRLQRGRPGELFGTRALAPLETPWTNGTTGDLLARMIQDADLSGNFYGRRHRGGIWRMRPDWVTIVLGSESDPDDPAGAIDAEVIGYLYHPGGRHSGRRPVALLPEEVAHYAPIPDPDALYRGMSWLTPVIREVMGDSAAVTHKLKFFENGATVNLVVSLSGEHVRSPDKFQEWVNLFEDQHRGVLNAYNTLYLGGGADAKPVGSNLKDIEYKAVQGHGETRIAAAAGIPPIIVGLSEGLEAATYSNYGQARRRLADGTMRPLWRNAAGSLASVIDVPAGAELWYDDRDIPFLQEDVKDAAEIHKTEAATISSLVDAGFTPESVVAAVTAGDLSRLEHTGLYSVQLQPPNPQDQQPGNGAPARGVAELLAPYLN